MKTHTVTLNGHTTTGREITRDYTVRKVGMDADGNKYYALTRPGQELPHYYTPSNQRVMNGHSSFRRRTILEGAIIMQESNVPTMAELIAAKLLNYPEATPYGIALALENARDSAEEGYCFIGIFGRTLDMEEGRDADEMETGNATWKVSHHRN